VQRRTVIIADDQPVVLAGLRDLLADFCTVLQEVNDGRALVKAALQRRPDLIILAAGLPLLNGIDAARQIRAQWPEAKLLFLTMYRRPSFVQQALAAGARGYVLKSASLEEIRRAVDAVLHGKIYVSSVFGDDALELLRSASGKTPRPAAELTPRQREILQLIAEGRSNKEVANILHISAKTVGFHRERVMHNLGVHTAAQLARAAVTLGVIADPDAFTTGGPVSDREILKDLWLSRLTEAKKRVDLAAARVQQIQDELLGMSSSEGNLARAQALRVVDDALKRYDRVRQIYTDLILHGKIPKIDWTSGEEKS
jgi:DNA-binding NarL/FixJ family response regulator